MKPIFFRSSHRKLDLILANQGKIMTQLDDLNTALNTLAADVTAEVNGLQAEIAALQAANPGIDLTAAIAHVNAIDAAVKAAIPAPAPAPAPTT